MIEKGAKIIRLGCLSENLKGLSFWKKQLYSVYKEIDYDGKPLFCLEKQVFKNPS